MDNNHSQNLFDSKNTTTRGLEESADKPLNNPPEPEPSPGKVRPPPLCLEATQGGWVGESPGMPTYTSDASEGVGEYLVGSDVLRGK